MIDVPSQRRHDHRQPEQQLELAAAEQSGRSTAALGSARLITDPTARAAAYGKIDDMIMALAPTVPWLWDYEANVASSNVVPVINQFNVGLVDLSFTSLK